MGTLSNILVNLSFEKKQLAKELENFYYKDFLKYMKNWLKSGRCVWYISGNCGHKEAIEIVEKAK